jgi:hypothetical protein
MLLDRCCTWDILYLGSMDAEWQRLHHAKVMYCREVLSLLPMNRSTYKVIIEDSDVLLDCNGKVLLKYTKGDGS